jgi:hypothetical protein
LKTFQLVSLSVLVAVLATGAFAAQAAAEESVLILTTTDTRAELVPCG